MPENAYASGRRTLSTFRAHLLLTCLIATASFALVIAVSIFVPLAAHFSHEPVDYEIAAGLAEHVLFLHAALWPIVLLSLCACVVAATILFQRMRAPLVRFMQCFDEIREGRVPSPIVIRTADYLHEESDALNEMVAALAERERRRAKCAQQIDALRDRLRSQGVDPLLLEELNDLMQVALDPILRTEGHGTSEA
jgi:hypothetical protein